MNIILIAKSIHIIGFVSWFAGMFYLVRMFVYYRESLDKAEPEKSILAGQFLQMQWRVYKIILNPAMMITWTAGIVMLVVNSAYLTLPWLHVKLLLLVLLTGYHLFCKRIIKQFEAGVVRFDSFQLRLFNEIPTLFLVSIVFIAVFGKAGTLNYMYLALGVILFAGMVFGGARAYKKKREKIEGESTI